MRRSAAAAATQPNVDWSVTPDAGGYRVTLRLPEQIDARDALPELAVNGTSIGVAQQSADGKSLSELRESNRMAPSRIKDCPPRPECPACGMSMIIIKRMFVGESMRCEYECLRCGHEETSQAA